MGGGGNFFSQIGQALSSIVGGGPSAPAPKMIPETMAPRVAVAEPEYKGNQESKPAASAATASDSQQSVNAKAGSGTMLTSNLGVDPESLELGRKTLLGG